MFVVRVFDSKTLYPTPTNFNFLKVTEETSCKAFLISAAVVPCKLLNLFLSLLEVLENGLLIKPVNNSGRDTWIENIEKVISSHSNSKDEGLLEDLLNDNDLEEYEW